MTDTINTLETQLAATTDLHQRVDLLNALAFELRFADLDRAIHLSEEAGELANQIDLISGVYQKGKADSLYHLGIFSTQRGDYDAAVSQLFKALLSYDIVGDQAQSLAVLNALGTAYTDLGDYPNAMDHYLRALEIARKINDKRAEAAALNSIGFLYMQLSDWNKALTYLQQSLVLARTLDDPNGQASTLVNSCNCYCKLGAYDNALACGLESIQLFEKLNDNQGLARAYHSVGETCQVRQDYQQALHYYEKSLTLSRSCGLWLEVARALQQISAIHCLRKQWDEALASLKQALDIAQSFSAVREQYVCHEQLAEVYRQKGDYKQALEHYEQHHCIKEAIFNEEADQRFKNLETSYRVETAQHEAEIYQLKNVALQKEIFVRKQTEAALQISNQKLQAEISERERLIADLNAFAHMVAHDLKNPLANLMVSSEMLWKSNLSELKPQTASFLDVIRQMASKMDRIVNELLVLASVRQQEIIPRPIDMAQIVAEAETRLTRLVAEHGATILKPEYWPVVLGYTPWIEEVWENYISNAIKYGGKPPRIELGAESLPNRSVRFWVRDNGNGIRPENQGVLFTAFTRLEKARASGQGLGLSIVKRIIEKLGGEVGVNSTGNPGEGSEFYFTLPNASTGELEQGILPF